MDQNLLSDQNSFGSEKFEGGGVKNFDVGVQNLGLQLFDLYEAYFTESWPHTMPKTLQKVFRRCVVAGSQCSALVQTLGVGLKTWTKLSNSNQAPAFI